MSDRTFYRLVLAVLAVLSLAFGFAGSASASASATLEGTAITGHVLAGGELIPWVTDSEGVRHDVCADTGVYVVCRDGSRLATGSPVNAHAVLDTSRTFHAPPLPRCTKFPLVNRGDRTCRTTATDAWGNRRPVTVERDAYRCHLVTYADTGEGRQATCWERGRFVTYRI